MTTKQDILKAVEAIPDKKIVRWYMQKFPKEVIVYSGAVLVSLGTILTAIKASKKLRAVPTFIVLFELIAVSCIHIPCWYINRKTIKRRCVYLGCTLEEYLLAI